MKILGLDEAGRGPVLGPLVLGAVLVDEQDLDTLSGLGVTDSKLMTRAQRETLCPQLETRFTTRTLHFTPAQLEENLTQVELGGLAELINTLAPAAVYIDAPVPPKAIPNFIAQLETRLNKSTKIVAENKAELRYSVVAAASIVAKVSRDKAMLKLHETYGDIGWGYPGEPKTRQFLQRCIAQGGFPDFVRTRWATVQKLKQKSLFGA